MLGLFQFGNKNKTGRGDDQTSSAETRYIKIRNIYYNYILAIEKCDEEKFLHAAPDDLIGCRPITKNGTVQKVKAVFFRRNELKLVA